MCIENPVCLYKKELVNNIAYKVVNKAGDYYYPLFYDTVTGNISFSYNVPKTFCHIVFNKTLKAKNIGFNIRSLKYSKLSYNFGFSSFDCIEKCMDYIFSLMQNYNQNYRIIKCRISGIIYKGRIPEGFIGGGLNCYNSEYIEFLEEVK